MDIDSKDPFNAAGKPAPSLKSPLEVARQSVQAARGLARQGDSALLVMGEEHHTFSHQVAESLALKELGPKAPLFMEFPHNRLYTILLDRGYGAKDASKLADHITASDTDGHITAKAIIGGNEQPLRGKNFALFQSQLLLQTAIHHGNKIVNVDAARVYPEDFCMDFSDRSTNETALKVNARRGEKGECGPDDMLIRNTHMADRIKAGLEKNGGVGLLATGAAHCFGIQDAANGLHHYKDSQAKRFHEIGLPAVMVSMPPDKNLPPDYEPPAGRQLHVFNAPGPSTKVDEMSDSDIQASLTKNNMDPRIYDPRNFAASYRAEFDGILRQAETDLGIKTPVLAPKRNTTSAPARQS
jgi:hypothetical protein